MEARWVCSTPRKVTQAVRRGAGRKVDGARRRSTTRSVVLDTSSGWLGPSSELQSTGIRPGVEQLTAAGGYFSIGVGHT
jgi:hypothetical protein